jgi:hypothetical protein
MNTNSIHGGMANYFALEDIKRNKASRYHLE